MAHLGNTIVNGALRVLGGEYVDTINGVAVGSSPKFTDTTYTFATGDSNGQIKVTPSGGTAQNVAVKGLGSAAYTNSGTYVYHRGNAGKSNMNDVGRLPASIGMTNLADPGNNYDNPMNGTTKATGWHLYYDASYSDSPSGSNAWVSQIVNTAGTHKWWVRSRNGGTITDGTEWNAGWRHLVVSPQAGQGGTTTPIYVDANGQTQNCSYTIAKSVPSNAVFTDTNNAVTQTATTTSADYEVLFSATADNTTRTEGARKNSNLKFNPSTGNLTVTKVNGESVKYSSSVSAVVGDTTCIISDSSITTTSLIEPFSSNSTGDTIAIKNIEVTAGKAVLTFKALTVDTSFRLRITNV